MHPAKPHTICGVHGGWAWSILLILAFLFGVPYVLFDNVNRDPLLRYSLLVGFGYSI